MIRFFSGSSLDPTEVLDSISTISRFHSAHATKEHAQNQGRRSGEQTGGTPIPGCHGDGLGVFDSSFWAETDEGTGHRRAKTLRMCGMHNTHTHAHAHTW